MRKSYSVLVTVVSVIAVAIVLAACGKEDEGNGSITPTEKSIVSPIQEEKEKKELTPTVEPNMTETPSPGLSEIIDDLSVEQFMHPSLPVTLNLPSAAKISTTDREVIAESDEYLIRLTGISRYNGSAIIDVQDFFNLVDVEKEESLVKILGLSALQLPDEYEVRGKTNIGGAKGEAYPFEKAELEHGGIKTFGYGEFYVIDAKDDIGVYTVVCIVKNTESVAQSERTEAVYSMLDECALSLRQHGKMEKDYVVLKNEMPDGAKIRIAYMKDAVVKVERDAEGFVFYYSEDPKGYFFVTHKEVGADIQSEDDYFNNLKQQFQDEVTTFSDVTDDNHKMKFRHITMNYTENDTNYTEEIYVCMDSDFKVWLLDLYGTSENVSKQKDNLEIMLASFEDLSEE